MDDVIYRLNTTAPPGEISLKRESWRILTLVNGERSIAEIAQAAGMDQATTTQVAFGLLQAGLLEIARGSVAPVKAVVDGVFFDQVTRQLASAIGPLAEIVIDEELENMGESRDQFPRDRIAELVERVSEAVPLDTARLKFQQIMLEAIRQQ